MTHDELVEKMLDEFEGYERSSLDGNRRMSAALRVAADELLVSVSDSEWGYRDVGPPASRFTVDAIFRGRRAKLERPKTLEERVTLSDGCEDYESSWSVRLDGKTKVTFGGSKEDAEIYRKGLIADLREKEDAK